MRRYFKKALVAEGTVVDLNDVKVNFDDAVANEVLITLVVRKWREVSLVVEITLAMCENVDGIPVKSPTLRNGELSKLIEYRVINFLTTAFMFVKYSALCCTIVK